MNADKVNADKAEYERRILAAIPLNEKILKKYLPPLTF